VTRATAVLRILVGLASSLGALLAALLYLVFVRAGRTWGLDGAIARATPRWGRVFA
jgi:hypothetical protein